MDTAAYYITKKGQKLGPFRFYQLQQFRTEEHFNESDFYPHEWQAFLDLVEGRKDQTSFIKKIEKNAETPRYFLRAFTLISYMVGVLIVIGALLQGRADYLLQSRPMLYVGGFFSVVICHTIIDRLTIRRLEKGMPKSRSSLLFWVAFGMLPLAAIIALVHVTATLLLDSWKPFAQQTLEVGLLFLTSGAIASLYRPFYLHILAVDQELPKRKLYSLPWLALLGLVIMTLVSYWIGPQRLPAPIGQYYGAVFTAKKPAVIETLQNQTTTGVTR